MNDEFKDHVATYSVLKDELGNKVERLVWAKPGTSIYRVNYLREKQRLFVSGDLGEAVYQWGEVVMLEWIAGLNLDYFAGKCQASETGRLFRDWNPERARARIIEWFRECLKYETEERKAFRRFRELRGFAYISSKEEWHHFLAVHGFDCFGEDPYSWPSDSGEVIALRCRLHLEGLKAAMEQLKDAKPPGAVLV